MDAAPSVRILNYHFTTARDLEDSVGSSGACAGKELFVKTFVWEELLNFADAFARDPAFEKAEREVDKVAFAEYFDQ